MFDPSEERLIEEVMRHPNPSSIANSVKARLSSEREKRLAFYDWLDEDKKAEFIDGEIVVHSPVVKRHADATLLLTKLLHTYALKRRLGYVATEKILVKLQRNDFEPDVAFWDAERAADFREDQLFFPAPDLVAEVLSPGTEQNDRTKKFHAYAREGVREYWMVDAKLKRVECYTLGENGGYGHVDERKLDGRLSSAVVEGFEVPVAGIFEEEAHLVALLAVLQS